MQESPIRMIILIGLLIAMITVNSYISHVYIVAVLSHTMMEDQSQPDLASSVRDLPGT